MEEELRKIMKEILENIEMFVTEDGSAFYIYKCQCGKTIRGLSEMQVLNNAKMHILRKHKK